MGVLIGENGNITGGQALAQPLIAAKIEALIPLDGSPQGESKLVAPKRRHLLSIKEVAGIHGTVAQILEDGPVGVIGSGFGDGADHSPGKSPILGAVDVGDDAKFPHRVHPRQRTRHASRNIAIVILNVGPIQQNRGLIGPGSADADLHACISGPRSGAGGGTDNSLLQGGQLHEVATVQRQVVDGLVIHQVSHIGRGGLNQ